MFLNRHHKYGSFENINITTCIQSLHYYDPIKVTCNVNNMDLLLAVFPSLMTKFAVTERHGVNCSWLIEKKKRRIVHFEQLHSIKSVHSFLCWLAFSKTHCWPARHTLTIQSSDPGNWAPTVAFLRWLCITTLLFFWLSDCLSSIKRQTAFYRVREDLLRPNISSLFGGESRHNGA